MAEKIISHDDIFETGIATPTKLEFDALNETLKITAQLIAGIKGKAAGLKGGLSMGADPKSLGDVEKIKRLTKETDNLDRVNKQITQTFTSQSRKLAEANALLSHRKKELSENAKLTLVANDSLAAMRIELTKLLRAYDELSAGQRNNKLVGGALLTQIQSLDTQVKGLEESTGRHQRSVGNYAKAFKGLDLILGVIERKFGIQLGWIRDSVEAAKGLTSGYKNLAGSLGETTGATEKATIAQRIWNAVKSTGVLGIGLLAVGIGLAAVAIWNYIEGQKESLKQLQDSIAFQNQQRKHFEDLRDVLREVEKTRAINDLKQKIRDGKALESDLTKLQNEQGFADKSLAINKKFIDEKVVLIMASNKTLEVQTKTITVQLGKYSEQREVDDLEAIARNKKRKEELAKKLLIIDIASAKELSAHRKIVTSNNIDIDADAAVTAADKIKETREKQAKAELDAANKQRDEFNKIQDIHIKHQLEAIVGQWGDAEQIIAKQQLATKIALGTATPDEVKFHLAQLQKEKDFAAKKGLDEINKNNERIAKNVLERQKIVEELGKSDLQLKILALERERDKILENEEFIESEILAIKKEFQDKIDELQSNAIKKRLQEELKGIEQMNDAVFDGLEERNEREKQLNQDKISELDKQMQFQQGLAIAGEANTHAALQKERAKALEEKAKLEARAAKRKEAEQIAEMFFEFIKVYLKGGENPASAAAKALAQTLIAKGISKAIAGAFAEGTEDLKGAGTETSDSNIALLSKGESVLTAKGTRETSGLATAINKEGFMGAQDWAMKNVFPKLLLQDKSRGEQVNDFMIAEAVKEIKGLRKDLSGKGFDFEKNVLGEFISIERKMGIVNETTFKKVSPSYSKH